MVNIPPRVTCKYISSFPFTMNSLNYFPRNLDNKIQARSCMICQKKNPGCVI